MKTLKLNVKTQGTFTNIRPLLGRVIVTLQRVSRTLIRTSFNTLLLLFGAHCFFKEFKVIHQLHVFNMRRGVECKP